jgi:Effector-associated domain 8
MRKLVRIVKNLPGFGNERDREDTLYTALGISPRAKDIVGSLDLAGQPDKVAAHIINRLAGSRQLDRGEDPLELFLTTLVIDKVPDEDREEIREIIKRSRNLPAEPQAQPLPTPDDFDPRIEVVKEAIRRNLKEIMNCNVLDEHGNEVWILDLVSTELGCDAAQPGKDLSEQILDFLIAECTQKDLESAQPVLMSLVLVFNRLLDQRKEEQAQRVAKIVDLMLPLCLPQHILSEAWRQLQDHQAVVIQNVVAKKAGAELVVAGLYRKPAKFVKRSTELTGEQLVPFEKVPIGHPERNVEPALRDLFHATFYPTETRATVEQMKADLRGHYRAKGLGEKRPCYCAVELAANQEDGKNQLALLSELGRIFLFEKGEPGLLFVALAPDSKTREFESFVITCLNTRFKSEERGKPA